MIQIRKFQYWHLKPIWNNLGKIGLNFLNIIPKLGKDDYAFFGNIFHRFISRDL